jgi:hypothetical protein
MRSTLGSLLVRTIELQEVLQRLCVFYRVSTLIVIEIDKHLRKIILPLLDTLGPASQHS